MLKGKKQISRQRMAQATPDAIWAILQNSSRLPDWVPAVNQVMQCENGPERPGAVRHCDVTMNGKSGRMVERCVALETGAWIAYEVVEETFGMSRMFDHYGFRISLEAQTKRQTRIILDTHYTPRSAIARLLNSMMIRRQLTRVVDDILSGLAQRAEQDSAQRHA